MFKIGEFSKLTQVTIRMLRYYDETGLLKPAIIDPRTGYRMYSSEQIPVLNRIVYLRDSGFNVSEIAGILSENEDNSFVKQLDEKYLEIEQTIKAEQEKLRKLELVKDEILNGKSRMCCRVLLKSIPGVQVLSLRRTVRDYYAEGELWKELCSFAEEHKIPVSGNTFSVYHDREYKEVNVDIELCAPVKAEFESKGDFICRTTEPIPIMACTMVYGDFENISGAYLDFAGWLQKNRRYRMAGLTRQMVHRGPWNEDNPERYLIELQIPLEISS